MKLENHNKNEKQRIRKANKKMKGGDANHEVYDN